MTTFQVHVRAVPRDRVPNDDAIRERLVRLVRDAHDLGRDAPSVIVVRERTVDALDPRSALREGASLPSIVVAMAGSTTLPGGAAEAVGIAGRLQWRRADGPAVPVVTVFLEWPDNRWWHWQAQLDDSGAILEHTAVVRTAEGGDALPDGLGRWWADARRRGVRIELATIVPAGDQGVEH